MPPVLVTPGLDAGPVRTQDVSAAVRRVLAPVDLTGATPHQLRIARGLAEALHVPSAADTPQDADQRVKAASGRTGPHGCAPACAARAKVTSATVPPPSRGWSVTVPCCSSIRRRTIGRPRPVPVFFVV